MPAPDDYAAYVDGQIRSLSEALTRVMFGDFTAVARTSEPDEAFGYLCVMINVAINSARNAHAELLATNEQLVRVNDQLRATVEEQARTQKQIQELNAHLEDLVSERTAELQDARHAAEQANRAKSEFLSRMSHELRTPLTAVLGFAQLLELGALPPDQHDAVQHIVKGGNYLLELINEVLDISRIETGDLALSLEDVSVKEIVGEALDLIRPTAATNRIDVVGDVGDTCGCYVIADRQRLKQVLLNLLSNGIKYNRPGGRVAVSCERPDPTHVRIKIADTGPGLQPDQVERLFVPFERLGAERTSVEGTGIGLALSRRLADAMGGRLDVDTVLGVGSTFWVEMARVENPAERYAGTSEIEPATVTASARRHSLLYIEDNPANLTLVQRVLESRPQCEVIPAMHGRLGIELAREYQPAVILLDGHLPDLRGEEVLRQLKGDPATAAIPVVIVSADATPGHVRRLLAAGAAGYLTKPFQLKDLLKVIDDLLA